MEVVLSPGRFGEETPGVPFQNEEIREWSHVDRLTGMLERARVETGRWQTSNQGAAKSYGKVIDSRERNSADGSVVQRARRQVEIFQSQGRGRSVQVVRASQWSSSRVTDSSSTNPPTLPVLNKKEEEGNKFVNLSILEAREKCLSPQEAISERLSTLLGTFAYPVSSTVPLRRIDSRYSSRAAIFKNKKKSTSNEDLASLSREKTLSQKKIIPRMENYAGISEKTKNKFYKEKLDRPRDDRVGESLEIFKNDGEKCSTIITSEEPPRSTKSAIHLLPSSKSNTTVVNLIRDNRAKTETEIIDNNKRSIVNWLLPGPSIGLKSSKNNFEKPITRNNDITDDSVVANLPGKIPKRVGFCKTEIHFAADSGKVNIVETDEKPPPTNKFRRRRRLTGITSDKIVPIVDSSVYETRIDEKLENFRDGRFNDAEDSTKLDHQRGHTTTVNLGSEILKNDGIGFPDGQYRKSNFPGSHEASSQGILLRLENRIYDRLETYSSEIPEDSLSFSKNSHLVAFPSTRMDIQASAPKSSRLVMNLTRDRKLSKVVLDNPEVSQICDDDEEEEEEEEEFFEPETGLVDDETRRRDQDVLISRYVDWENDNEVKAIMLGPDDEKIYQEFVTSPSSKDTKNIHENKETLLIANEEIEKIEPSVSENNVSPPIALKTDHSTEDYDVVCTDAENNQVVLKVVTTHEPMIARVENDHFRKRIKKKSTDNEKSLKNEITSRKTSQNEHTYVNVFTGSERAPIYENYKISNENSRKIGNPIKKDSKLVLEKCPIEPETKTQILKSNHSSITGREVEISNLEKIKTCNDEKLTKSPASSVNSPIDSQKIRVKSKDDKLLKVSKKSSVELLQSPALKNSPGTWRLRTSKVSKNSSNKRVPIKSQNSVSSVTDRGSRLSSGISSHDNKSNPSKSCPREISTARETKKNETRQKPMEVVYQTAVYNMKNEKLSKPQKGKESRGPRYLNELICGAKTKRPSESKSKTSSTVQHSANNKAATQTVRHWK